MKKLPILLLFCLIHLQIFANGGPIDGSAVVKTGRIKMVSVNGIKIVSEKINVRIEGDYAIYDVLYKFYKENDYNTNITYGFPVDFTYPNHENREDDSITFEDFYIPSFKMYFQKHELPIQQQIDFTIFNDTINFNHGFEDKARTSCKRKWYISTISFDKTGFYELNVQYKVKNFFSDWWWGKSFLPSYSNRTLRYDLSPASYWDDGVIDTFSVCLNVQNLDSCYQKYQLKGLENAKYKNGIIEFQQCKFDLFKYKNFELVYSNSNQHSSQLVISGILHNDKIKYSISPSCNLANLFDTDFKTNVKIIKDRKIDFNLNNSEVSTILLVNGDYSDSVNYKTHKRIKKIRITSDLVLFDDFGKKKKFDTIIVLPNHNFVELRKNNFFQNADVLWEAGYKEKMKRFTVEILKPKLAKNEEVYISELIFAYETL
jgi:hypothetical protein